MYAIVDIAGQQHKVKKKQKIYVHRLDAAEGSQVEFNKVLLVDNEGAISVGMPFVDGTRVAAKVVAHVKDDKVLVFKKKRRKGYKRLNGHRQYLTELLIQGILGKGEILEVEEEEIPVEEDVVATEEGNGDGIENGEEMEQEEVMEEEAVEEEAPKKKKKTAAPKAKKAPAKKKSSRKKSEE
jgi:large subunit ribosomal protein L21